MFSLREKKRERDREISRLHCTSEVKSTFLDNLACDELQD